jgi:hypothetical protein
VVSIVLMVAAVGWRVSAIMEAGQHTELPPPVLEPCQVERETLVRGTPRGSFPRLEEVRTFDREEAEAIKIGRHGKFLITGDPVIGVALGDEACAYPIRFLEWHEVVHHELGGVPLAICWSPLSGSAGVFDRRVGKDTLTFVPSGWLSDSESLLLDEARNLWSSLLGKAITGPPSQAGHTLTRIPYEVMRWEDWQSLHPTTRVLSHDAKRMKLYKRAPYRNYQGSLKLRFPAEPLPAKRDDLPYKASVLAVRAGGVWRVYPIRWLLERATEGVLKLEQEGKALTFYAWRNAKELSPTARVVGADSALHTYWFAWHAARPQDATLGLE